MRENKPMRRLLATVALLVAQTPVAAHAANFGQGALPYEQPLAVLLQSVTGPIAFTMSVIGIVVAGIALIFGGNLGGFIKQMVMLVLAISVVVGATNLMGSLFGQGAVLVQQVPCGAANTRNPTAGTLESGMPGLGARCGGAPRSLAGGHLGRSQGVEPVSV